MDNFVVEVNNLTKKFGRFVAVDDISFSIKKGEIVGFLGPNGAGKTTTIQMLLGLITPSFGKIKIFGKDFFTHREEILIKMNFSSTYTNLPWRLSVWENLHVVALLYGVANPKEKVETVINRLNLKEIKDKTVDQLSSGWITRLNLARTFINDPQLILLDEPTASLDPEAAANIRSAILQLNKKSEITVLWTSHNMAEVEEVCDRVIFLQKGKIVAEDTPEGLAKTIKFCRVILMIEQGYERLASPVKSNNWKMVTSERFTTIELTEQEIPVLLNLLMKEKIHYSEISVEKPTLEDFFLSKSKEK